MIPSNHIPERQGSSLATRIGVDGIASGAIAAGGVSVWTDR
jgi:hypothetical protein